MSDNLEVWAAWAQILSFPISVASMVLVILGYLFPNPPRFAAVAKRIRPWLLYVLIASFFFWVGTRINASLSVSSLPPVSLISLGFEVNEYDLRKVDLRTASTSGIPVTEGQALRLTDVWFSAMKDAPPCVVQAEVYANGQIIGSTSPSPLIAGQTKLDSVKIKNYNHGDYPTSWKVQPEWKDLQVFLITYREGKVVDRNLTNIHLAKDGTAWYIDPPNVSLVSVVYTINNGPELVLDLRHSGESLNAGSEDILMLQEIWYDSNADCRGCMVHVEANLLDSQEAFDSETFQETPPNFVRKGIHKLDFTPMSWTIPSNKQSIDLTLFRNDRTAIDMLILPLR